MEGTNIFQFHVTPNPMGDSELTTVASILGGDHDNPPNATLEAPSENIMIEDDEFTGTNSYFEQARVPFGYTNN